MRTNCLKCRYLHILYSMFDKWGYLCSHDFVARTKKETKVIKNCPHYQKEIISGKK